MFKKKPDNIAFISGADKTMEDAMFFARENIDVFWAAQKSGDRHNKDFALKVGFHLEGADVEVEHMWVADPEAMEEGYRGILASDSHYSEALRAGQPVGFFEDDITDWQYSYRGKAYGHFTTRVLLQDMGDAERNSILRSLKWKSIDG